MILILKIVMVCSFAWISSVPEYPRSITPRRCSSVRGVDATTCTVPPMLRLGNLFTTDLAVLRPFMARSSNDEKSLNESTVGQEGYQMGEAEDQDKEVKRATFFGLEPKQEVDPLDNGMPVLGPIIFFLQFYIAYLLFTEVPLTDIQEAIP